MSQASRSRVVARYRQRKQLARELVRAGLRAGGEAWGAPVTVTDLLEGCTTFDVFAARAHAHVLMLTCGDNDHARNRRRLGLVILDALKRQLLCEGTGNQRCPSHTSKRRKCLSCHGTGHNLRGVLPAITWDPVVIRKVHDSAQAPEPPGHIDDDWTSSISLATWAPPQLSKRPLVYETRSSPRGEHLTRDEARIRSGLQRALVPRSEVPAAVVAELTWCPKGSRLGYSAVPRWRRAEIAALKP